MRIIYFILSLVLLSGCSSPYEIANIDSEGENIIFFGNSITEGMGASKGNDFPNIISKKLGISVINAGISGNTTQDALCRIDSDVIEKDPLLVILEFGANDFFRNIPLNETINNIDKIVYEIQKSGAMVILLEVKVGLYDRYLRGFRRIAKNRKAYLVPNILKGIMRNRELMSDGIHPNDKGYKRIAEKISGIIEQLLILNKEKQLLKIKDI